MEEKVLERKLVSAVKQVGGWAIKMSPQYATGIPDRLCIFRGGRIVFVEMKAPGKKPRSIQLRFMERLISLGCNVTVIDSENGIQELVNKYHFPV